MAEQVFSASDVDPATGIKADGKTAGALFPRHAQTFPALTAQEIARVRDFGELRSFREGEKLFETGRPGPGMFVILSGHVAITQRDGLGHVTPVIEQGPGQFLAEISQLSGRVALVDGHAEDDVETLLIAPERLRALLVAEADLGERIMRALILRRVGLIQGGVGGPVLIGPSNSSGVIRLQSFLTRNGFPHHLLDPERDHDAADLIARYLPSASDWPLVVTLDGSVLRNPGESEIARALGMIGAAAVDKLYDAAIVGCGPAGLATAVYAASEGLSVVVLDARAFGGQAGASARIENYLGFPTGISGQALAGRAFTQAQKFGADIMYPWASRRSIARARMANLPWRLTAATPCGRALSWWRAEHATGGPASKTSAGLKAAACGTGPRPLRRGFARNRKSSWSAVVIRPGKRRCSCRVTPAGSTW